MPDQPTFIDTLKAIDAADISPHAFRLYVHVALNVNYWGGACNKRTRELAEACNMSPATVTKAKRELVEVGALDILEEERPHGGQPKHILTAKMADNFTFT